MNKGDKIKTMFSLIWTSMPEEIREATLNLYEISENDIQDFLREGQNQINTIDKLMETGPKAYE